MPCIGLPRTASICDSAATKPRHEYYSVLDQGFATFVGFIEQEVRTEFDTVLRRARHPELVTLVRRSDELLEDTCLNELEFD